jgi:hypothetical protein
LLLAFPACSSSETLIPDGDTPTDGDSEVLDGDTSDPCTGAAVDCAPGSCEAREGKPFCICPENYHAERYNCVPDDPPDGDNESMDGDTPIDGDMADGDGADGDDDIPNCTAANNVFPCRANLPLEVNEETGEFSILVESSRGYSVDVWENWAVAIIGINNEYFSPGGGAFLINLTDHRVYKIGDQHKLGADPLINDSHVIWAEVDTKGTTSTSDDDADLFLLDIETMQIRQITTSRTQKHEFAYEHPHPYWLDHRNRIGRDGNPLYSLDAEGNEIRVDNMITGEGIADYRVFGDTIAYVTGDSHIGVIDRANSTWRILPVTSDVFYRYWPELWGNLLFYSDGRERPEGQSYAECWLSLYQYNLETNEETVIHKNTDSKDYMIEDAWEDWVLFSYYAEGHSSSDNPDWQYCASANADGDLFVRYLPTGEEWNITNHIGNQHYASMWGAHVVWLDTRENLNPTYGSGNFYGVDLCKHSELKSRFAECAERDEAKR